MGLDGNNDLSMPQTLSNKLTTAFSDSVAASKHLLLLLYMYITHLQAALAVELHINQRNCILQCLIERYMYLCTQE